jgi:ABC-type uncharacterized transport system involved in gliding motility auxiliary subunit
VIFALLGSVLLLFGVLAIFTGSQLWIATAHFAVGAGLLIYAALTSMGELRAALGRDSARRGLREGGNALTQLVAITVILGCGAYLANRYPVRWDWTEAGVHTLTQSTRDVLAQIPAETGIEVLAFLSAGSGAEARRALDTYAYESERFQVAYHDPIRRPELAQRFDVERDGVLIVCNGPCDEARGTVRVVEPSEQELTSAVRSVISERQKVYFVSGHGEAGLADEEARGASRAALFLKDENVETAELLLAQEGDVPADASAVLVAGPSYGLFERELEALDRYLRGGGSLMVLVDPLVASGLEETLLAWGVEIGNDVIVDETVDLFAGPRLGIQAVVATYGAHPATEKMDGLVTMFRFARSVRPAEGSDAVELLTTGPRSWAESDVAQFQEAEPRVKPDPETDIPGPVSIGVARTFPVDGSEDEGRLVVIGDADFARNGFIGSAANADLLINLVNWLTGQEQFITVERKLPRPSTTLLSSAQVATFRYLALFGLPEAVLLLGIWSWWRRRE